MKPRPAVVTILGHVDHGKTTLLDFIRKSGIASKEHGGITQRIGAYEVTTGIPVYRTDRITFIDTPGHEAFSKLRARGANVSDLAILIIDAKDSVMPQTEESIAHIKSAGIPFVVALNKTDLPDANPDKVKNDLLKYQVMTEGKGGDVPVAEISAKTGKGVPELLETLLLMAEDMKLEYDEKAPAEAYVVETKKDNRGVVVSVIVRNGTISVGDVVFAGHEKAKIRSLVSDIGTSLRSVTPSSPAEILGFNTAPEVGTKIAAVEIHAETIKTEPEAAKPFNMQEFLKPTVAERVLSLVVKTDSQGSLEAIKHVLSQKENIKIILISVGHVNKSDVFLAKTTKAIVIGFAVNVSRDITDLAKQEKVIIKTYNIIYDLLDELQEVADLLTEKENQEKHIKGEASIAAEFIIEGEKISGMKVTKGKINLSDEVEVFRGDNLIGTAKVVSIKMRAKPVSEVKKNQEAGMILSSKLDFHVGDVIKSIS